jgi:hypothetical protein
MNYILETFLVFYEFAIVVYGLLPNNVAKALNFS